LPYNPLREYQRPRREKHKGSDIGEGPTKICILGIISYETDIHAGCTVSWLMRDLGRWLRAQNQDRVGRFLDDLEHRELIEKIDMKEIRKGQKGYIITGKGKKRLEEYFSVEYREIRDISQSLSGTTYTDIKKFWEEHGRDY
jgi:DNA-binding PadR family transcriptional regulator